MLVVSGIDDDPAIALGRAREALETGRAAETFGRMVHALGGPTDFVENYDSHLAGARLTASVAAPRDGHVTAIRTRAIGVAVVELGGGRRKREDEIDHAVGITGLQPVGTSVTKGDPLALVHARDEATLEAAREAVLAAYDIADEKPEIRKPVAERIPG
jgi:thymidine phosphorylase